MAPELCAGLTPAQITAASVMRDYEHLKAFCNDEWHYVGVVVTAPDGEKESGWGFESTDDEGQAECAADLADTLESAYQDKQTEEATL